MIGFLLDRPHHVADDCSPKIFLCRSQDVSDDFDMMEEVT
jgi:hypothetical protein